MLMWLGAILAFLVFLKSGNIDIPVRYACRGVGGGERVRGEGVRGE